jgi:Ca2+-binding RTX toxin-like protein
MTNFIGTSGNDTLNGTSGDDTFDMSQGGNDSVAALAGNDIIGMGAKLTALDAIDGGDDSDTLTLAGNYYKANAVTFSATTVTNIETIVVSAGSNYRLTSHDGTVAAGKTLTLDSSALGSSNRFNFDGSAESDGTFVVIGGAGKDFVTGGALNDTISTGGGNDKLFLGSGGDDTASGGDGDDHIIVKGALTAADHIDGGAGSDDLLLNGDYSGGLVCSATTFVNVETLIFRGGHFNNLTLSDPNVADGAVLTVEGVLALAVSFNASAETSGRFNVTVGSGDDVIITGAGNDKIDLSLGGNDTVHGGDGSDRVFVGAALTTGDLIDGGVGLGDVLELDGDYGTGLVLGDNTIQNFETLQLDAGHSYAITGNDNLVHTGQNLKILANTLAAGDNLTFDDSSESAGSSSLTILSGAGDDVLRTGSGDDVIDISTGGNDTLKTGFGDDTILAGSSFSGADSIFGDKGNDVIKLQGDYSGGLTILGTTISKVERLDLLAGTYKIAMSDRPSNLGSLTINNLSGNPLIFDASAQNSGDIVVNAGAGQNSLIGGAASDNFNGGGNLFGNDNNDRLTGAAASDTLDGGAGNDWLSGQGGADVLTGGIGSDTFYFGNAKESTSVDFDTIVDFQSGFDTLMLATRAKSFAVAVDHSVSMATFDSDIAAVAVNLQKHDALVYTVTSGDLAGKEFLIIGFDNAVGYQAQHDLVILIQNGSSFSLADFA